MPPSPASLPPSILAIALGAALAAQSWELTDSGGSGGLHGGLAYDEARGQLVRFGGEWARYFTHDETRIFDGVRWVPWPGSGPVSLPNVPALMTWDDVRAVVLLCNETTGDLWEWNGSWTRRADPTHPPIGDGRAFAFDRARARAVLCTANSTWEWSGTAWSLTGAATPSVAGATFLPTRGKVVALAGRDLFEWSGTAWTQITTNLLPVAVQPLYSMAFDGWRLRLVIVETNALPVTVHEWDGINLVSRAAAGAPPQRRGAAAAFDPSHGKTMLCGGEWTGAGLSDTWGWDGQAWTEHAVAPNSGSVAIAFDAVRNRLVASGVLAAYPVPDTWERDATGWHRLATGLVPGNGPMVFDPVLGQVLLCVRARLYQWNGATWTFVQAPLYPPVRYDFPIAFDAARGEVVMFGGLSSSGPPLNDTWLWNGSSWRQATTAVAPSGRFKTAMAYDAQRQRTLLFGGTATSLSLGDTWEWDGLTWLQRNPAHAPLPRQSHAMAWDERRRLVTMTGGASILMIGGGLVPLRMPVELWSWDGNDWTDTPIGGPLLAEHAMAYDASRGHLVIQGGVVAESIVAAYSLHATSDTFDLVTRPASTGTSELVRCPVGVVAPRLRPESLPFTGNPNFAIAVTGAAPNSPCVLGIGPVFPPIVLPGGCSWWLGTTGTIAARVTNTGGAARWSLPVPNRPALIGLVLFAQAVAFDAAGQVSTSGFVDVWVGE